MRNDEKDNLENGSKSDEAEKPLKKIWQLIGCILARVNWGLVVATLSLIATIIIGYVNLSRQVSNVRDKVDTVDNRVESVQQKVLAGRFVIISPSDGASVDATDIVRGKSPFPEMNHYIVITPLKTGDDFVQDNPAKVDVTGSFASNARFGTGDVGIGEKFFVRVLITKSTIPPGILKAVPPDAEFSESVTVKREK
jgi:hypothetical protein